MVLGRLAEAESDPAGAEHSDMSRTLVGYDSQLEATKLVGGLAAKPTGPVEKSLACGVVAPVSAVGVVYVVYVVNVVDAVDVVGAEAPVVAAAAAVDDVAAELAEIAAAVHNPLAEGYSST